MTAFYSSSIGLVVMTITASISTLSSGVVILVISRSSTKLRSIYHRILFFKSISDILSSLAMALSTLMMPSDMIYEFTYGIHPLGNWTTCNIQGFSFTFGTMITFCCDAILCIYYLCSIKYGMKDRKFSSRIEPLLYLGMIAFALFYNIRYVLQDEFNPGPARAWCARATYPPDCETEEECIRGGGILQENMKLYGIAYLILVFVQISSMILIVLHVYFKERSLIKEHESKIKEYESKITNICVPEQEHNNGQSQDIEICDDESFVDRSSALADSCDAELSFCKSNADNKSYSRNIYGDHRILMNNITLMSEADKARHPQHESFAVTRVIVKQALAYTTLFLVMLPILLLSFSTRLLETSLAFGMIHAIIRPSHGTFNMMIFIAHKCYNLRRINSDLTYADAFWRVWEGGKEEPENMFLTLAPVREGDDQSEGIVSIEIDFIADEMLS
eukprot:scaffold3559_cov284-Chaetoceros_neogracile.AAC.8